MGDSVLIRPTTVDFDAAIMKLSDNDERLVNQIKKALKVQKEVSDKK